MKEFQVGDRVTSTYSPMGAFITDVATIIRADGTTYLLEFDRDVGGHDGGKPDQSVRRWWADPESMTLVRKPLTVGCTVQALDLKNDDWTPYEACSGKFGTVMHLTHDEKGHVNGAEVKFRGIHNFANETLNQSVHIEFLKLVEVDPVEEVKRTTPVAKPITKTFSPKSQCGKLLTHLAGGRSITPLEAFGTLGIYRLAARIFELKKAGHKIITNVRMDDQGKTYARYSLKSRRFV